MKTLTALLIAAAAVSAAPARAADTPATDAVPVTKTEMAKDYAQQTKALTPAETKQLAELNALSLRIINMYVPNTREDDITPEILDRAYAAWLKDLRTKHDPDAYTAAFGVRLGMLTLQPCNGAWIHVQDNYGDTLAVEFRNTSQQIYPIDSVRKRYSRQEVGFFAAMYKVYLQACHKQLK